MVGQLYDLPADMRRHVQKVVRPGEKILWAGRPTWRAIWGRLLGILLFALFWSAISLPFGVMIIGGASGLLEIKFNGSAQWPLWARIGLPVFIAPFVAISIILLSAPFIALWQCARTVHVITDARLINVWPRKAVSIDPSTISSVTRKKRDGGSGTITIGLGWHTDSEGDKVERLDEWSGVPAADRAEMLIRNLRSRTPA